MREVLGVGKDNLELLKAKFSLLAERLQGESATSQDLPLPPQRPTRPTPGRRHDRQRVRELQAALDASEKGRLNTEKAYSALRRRLERAEGPQADYPARSHSPKKRRVKSAPQAREERKETINAALVADVTALGDALRKARHELKNSKTLQIHSAEKTCEMESELEARVAEGKKLKLALATALDERTAAVSELRVALRQRSEQRKRIEELEASLVKERSKTASIKQRADVLRATNQRLEQRMRLKLLHDKGRSGTAKSNGREDGLTAEELLRELQQQSAERLKEAQQEAQAYKAAARAGEQTLEEVLQEHTKLQDEVERLHLRLERSECCGSYSGSSSERSCAAAAGGEGNRMRPGRINNPHDTVIGDDTPPLESDPHECSSAVTETVMASNTHSGRHQQLDSLAVAGDDDRVLRLLEESRVLREEALGELEYNAQERANWPQGDDYDAVSNAKASPQCSEFDKQPRGHASSLNERRKDCPVSEAPKQPKRAAAAAVLPGGLAAAVLRTVRRNDQEAFLRIVKDQTPEHQRYIVRLLSQDE